MFVGVPMPRVEELQSHIDSVDSLFKYSDSLVPEKFRHNKKLLDNQRYVCVLTIRQAPTISWEKKKDLIDAAMSVIRPSGLTDKLLSLSMLDEYINTDKLLAYYRKEKNERK